MNNRYCYALTLCLIECLHEKGSWCGETHIQKNMYVFESLFDVQSDLNFTLYKHGPYSFILHDIINDLYGLKFIEAKQIPPYGPRIYLTESGRIFMKKYQISEQSKLKAVTSRLGFETVQGLEKLATALMIARQAPEKDVSQRAAVLHEIKPHISLEDAKKATRSMDTMQQELSISM